jgi:hypothetical protein
LRRVLAFFSDAKENGAIHSGMCMHTQRTFDTPHKNLSHHRIRLRRDLPNKGTTHAPQKAPTGTRRRISLDTKYRLGRLSLPPMIAKSMWAVMDSPEDDIVSIHTRLSAERPVDRVAAIARVAVSRRDRHAECPVYFAALNMALRDEPPPFGTEGYSEIYHAASTNGHWLAVSLITNAEREGDGATRLWSLAACSPDGKERQSLKRHAVDESRHALAYLRLLDLSFPEAVSPSFRSELNALSPGYSMEAPLFAVEGSPYAKEPSIDDFLQMNIAEIRTTIHHLMQRSALAMHCPADNLAEVTQILNSLLHDELHHVAYTAVLIERKAMSAKTNTVSELLRKRLRDFNEITRQELGDNNIFDCSVACCAKRPSCRSKVPAPGFVSAPI